MKTILSCVTLPDGSTLWDRCVREVREANNAERWPSFPEYTMTDEEVRKARRGLPTVLSEETVGILRQVGAVVLM